MRIGDREFEVSTDRYHGGWRSTAFLPGGRQRASATCDSREGAEMDLYQKLKDEFAPTPKFDPNKRYEAEDPKSVFRKSIDSQVVGYVIVWLDKAGKQHVSRFQATSPEDAVETLQFGYANVEAITHIQPMSQAQYLAHYGDLSMLPKHNWNEARQIIENLDSLEGGVPRQPNPFQLSIDRLLKGPDYEPELRYDYHPTDPKFKEQWPEPEPKWHPGHRSARMSINRNTRRRSFGYSDVYSLRDRGWPYANRGFDRRRKAWERAVARFGQVRPGGEGV